ncbi:MULTISPECIES: DUF3943 domain-containing protein [Pseudomonadati]|uniref:DUF3943 domain-containing protein n=1 Tax=Shewanella aestuarii TaxID=1028752 RepID=A0ABT0L0N9_9GAMM|nr:DUF3943 domain-containing protein [Shewanella aestuarii]MCL1117272.1 DUF3943 domain-containing protein [Shewanella aestuarii]GGN74421.1 hypothetical protein GCM10009193_13470 [Shewanella aestuarii]
MYSKLMMTVSSYIVIASLGIIGSFSLPVVAIEASVSDEEPKDIQKNWWGATAELSSILILGGGLYSISSETMKQDFDYEIEGDTAEYFYDRLTTNEAWKYDDNDIGMNWGHAYAGALYHQAFRNHGFNYYESVIGTFVASTIWEVFAEYKEVVSINDQVVTIWGGAVLGESLYQFSDMLKGKEGWVPATLSWVFNPAGSITQWAGYGSPSRFNRSQSQDKFSLYTGLLYSERELSNTSTSIFLLGIDASIDDRKGLSDGFSSTPSLIDMEMETGLSANGIEDWQMATQVWLGGYKRHFDSNNHLADSWSQSVYIGPSTGMEYTSLGTEQYEDFYAVVNVLGLSAAANWGNEHVNFELRTDIFADFSMVKPYATQEYLAQGHNFWGTKSVLWEGEYGYAWGNTFNLSLAVKIDDLAAGVKIKSQRWDSIDGKSNERMTSWNPNVNDIDFEDARDRYQIYLNYALSSSTQLGLHYERFDRYGVIRGIDNPQIFSRHDDIEQRTWFRVDYIY